MTEFSGKFIKVSEPTPHVFLLELNRKPVNAFSTDFWTEYGQTIDSISEKSNDVRVLVISSALPKFFTAGLDLTGISLELFGTDSDAARRAYNTRSYILEFQHAITAPSRCQFPVITAVHGLAMGLGMDMISACDIRYASEDATFCIKQIDVGLAPDIGTLAYLPKITSNASLAHELVYTTRPFSASEALSIGLVSKVVPGGRDGVVKAALNVAGVIASKGPVAVASAKRILLHARDNSVAANLEYTSVWNGGMLHTPDLKKAGIAQMTKAKEAPEYPPLRKPSSKL